MERKWYAIHTLTGCEQKVVTSLRSRAETASLTDRIGQILIPTEKVSEVKDGKKKISERKFFPGYILVEMEMTDESWYLVKNTPGVTGFVGSGNKPLPLPESEIKNIIDQQVEKATKPKPKVDFQVGESVRVREGAFANFNGTIDELNPNKGKLRVMVKIFGRATPVELEYWQVEKL
jgi:transcriptional antiterminator NusG